MRPKILWSGVGGSSQTQWHRKMVKDLQFLQMICFRPVINRLGNFFYCHWCGLSTWPHPEVSGFVWHWVINRIQNPDFPHEFKVLNDLAGCSLQRLILNLNKTFEKAIDDTFCPFYSTDTWSSTRKSRDVARDSFSGSVAYSMIISREWSVQKLLELQWVFQPYQICYWKSMKPKI